MNDAILAAIFGGVGTIIGAISKAVVDIIKAKRENDADKQKLEDLFNALNERVNDGFEKIDQTFKNIGVDIDNFKLFTKTTAQIQKTTIRHQITEVYYQYCQEKAFPEEVKEDICYLYDSYIKLGGNTYIHQLYDEMMNWNTK